MTERSAAILTIKKPGSMTASGRRQLAAWLARQASDLLKHGKDYTDKTFRSRYLYR